MGGLYLSPDGPFALGLWAMIALFVLQHLLPWDTALERRVAWAPDAVEIVLYAGVGAVLVLAALARGISDSGVPVGVIAVFASVLLARALFELGILYGGADAKALMVAGLLVPLFPHPLWTPTANAGTLLTFYPFALSLLMDAALFSLVVPVALLVKNLRAGDFVFPRAFTGFMIDVEELPDRFVWLKDPTFERVLGEDEEEPETSEDDRRLRERQRDELRSRGVRRVWVTPQIPFLVLLTAGAVGAVLAGNVIFDILALL
ncbi:MAG: A24 family peptidase C-terminal domain-containing protein [Candidatus Lutacidiplasmatales archaeon]